MVYICYPESKACKLKWIGKIFKEDVNLGVWMYLLDSLVAVTNFHKLSDLQHKFIFTILDISDLKWNGS